MKNNHFYAMYECSISKIRFSFITVIPAFDIYFFSFSCVCLANYLEIITLNANIVEIVNCNICVIDMGKDHICILYKDVIVQKRLSFYRHLS